jgi:hypothetical protein
VVKPIGPETLVRLLRSGVEHEEGANEAAGAHLKKLN